MYRNGNRVTRRRAVCRSEKSAGSADLKNRSVASKPCACTASSPATNARTTLSAGAGVVVGTAAAGVVDLETVGMATRAASLDPSVSTRKAAETRPEHRSRCHLDAATGGLRPSHLTYLQLAA